MAPDRDLDVTSLCCPVPLLRLSKVVSEMAAGQQIRITGDDPIFEDEIRDYCEDNAHEVLEVSRVGRRVSLLIRI